jgi:hypothetical protein
LEVGIKGGFFGARFFTFESCTHTNQFSISSKSFKATIRAPGWGGVVVTRVDSPSASCEFDSRPHLRSNYDATLDTSDFAGLRI